MAINNPQRFANIGLFAKYNNTSIADTFQRLVHFLANRGHKLYIEEQSNTLLEPHDFPVKPKDTLGEHCDLVLVVGGDGSLLNAARAIVSYQVPILGINRGRLGFLADTKPQDMEEKLSAILDGVYIEEQRFLLSANIMRAGKCIAENQALNDIVLYTGALARMIEFEVYIDEQFVLRQRSDGLITATPTGSTAYALSGGGPILYPTLNTLVLVPMFPHTLSSRPIVVSNACIIKLVISENNEISPKMSFDGQVHLDLKPGDEIIIQKYPHDLTLIHPKDHDYFMILREKLGWSTNPIKN
jgi:NAD+ kinase